MKTVVILIDQIYMHGGIEKLVAIKANYWSEKFGYKIIIVSTEQKHNPPVYELSKNIKFIDIAINYDRSSSYFHPKNFRKLYLNVQALKKIYKSYKPDFILVAGHIPMTYVLPFLGLQSKIIKEFHFSKFNRNGTKKEIVFSSIERKYDYLVVLSKEEKMFYSPNKTTVIPNPVISLPDFVPNIIEKNNIAGAILRFAPVKQIEKMVEAWELFYQKNPDWKLYLYGATNNEYFQKINKHIKDKNLEKTIIFKGQTENVIKALSEIKVLLMTSANECFPMVILEANSCGVPVVSFDSPTGPRNIINHNINGIIVPLNDIKSFADELHNLIHDKNRLLHMSEASITNSKQYEIDRVMSVWKKEIFEKNA